MSKDALAKVVQRAISDAAFRRQLNSDPTGALRGFDLSSDELSALRAGDAGRLSTLGIDQRMSKAYSLGGALASTRMSQSDLTPGGGPAMVDELSGAGGRTIIPGDPTRPGGSADADGGAIGSSTVRAGDDYKFAGRQTPDGSGTSTVRAGDDYKFAGRVAPEGGSSVRTGDDWKFTDRVSAEGGSSVRTGDDWKFADRAASQGAVAPVEGSPEATAADIAGGSVTRAHVIHDDPDGFLAANANADVSGGSAGGTNLFVDDSQDPAYLPTVGYASTANANADAGGSVTRANVIHDDPDGFLAAQADATGGADAPTTAFVDESESYLTKVGYDATEASASGGATAIRDDPDGFLAANADAGGADTHAATDEGQNTPS